MEYLADLSALAKTLGIDVNPVLVKIPLYDLDQANEFQSFLVEERLKPFLKLKLLSDLDTDFVIGYSSVEQSLYDDSGENLIEIRRFGPTIIKKLFTSEQIFNYILQNLAIAVLLIKDPASLLHPRLADKEYLQFGNEDMKDQTFISKNLIITNTHIFVEPEHKISVQNLLQYHAKIFDRFLEKYKEKDFIPHDVYIDWLLSWFPGKIHVRSIE